MVGERPGAALDFPVTGAGECGGIGTQALVDGASILGRQTCRFTDENHGAPFVEVPGAQPGHRVWHLVNECPRETEMCATSVGRFASCKPDLRGNASAPLRLRLAALFSLVADRYRNSVRDHGLSCDARALRRFERRNDVDAGGRVDIELSPLHTRDEDKHVLCRQSDVRCQIRNHKPPM